MGAAAVGILAGGTALGTPAPGTLGTVKRLVLVSLLLAVLVGTGQASAATFPCGLSGPGPLRAEYAGNAVLFRMSTFGRPGIVVAAHDAPGSELLRQLGARTVYWYMKLQRIVGTPPAPADPATVEPAAQTLFDNAVRISGCSTPVIVLNELWGQYRPTPWTPETIRYRQNILVLVKALAARGAVPLLLVPGPWYGRRAPFVGGDAMIWWSELARYAHIVREMHFDAPYIRRLGPIIGARTRRIAMRNAVAPFLGLGIPAERMGLMLGFQSGPGKGGREGLKPREAWFEIVKQDALSARQVAGELGLGSIWSWGWATFSPESADPDKAAAACVYLWTYDPTLCDGPAAAGPRFNASLTLGQILLPPEVQCQTRLGRIEISALERLEPVLGDRREALAALLTRLVQRRERGVRVTAADIARAERDVADRAFGGDTTAFAAFLAERGLERGLAREILADQLRAESFGAVVQIRYGATSPGSFATLRVRDALRTAICVRDELPPPSAFDWGASLAPLQVTPSTVSVATSRGVVPRGGTAVLSGRVAGIRDDRRVTVYARRSTGSGYVAIRSVPVAADGHFDVTVSPSGTTFYRVLAKGAVSPALLVRAHGHR